MRVNLLFAPAVSGKDCICMMESLDIPDGNSGDRALLVEGGGMRGAFSSGVIAAMCEYFPSSRFSLVLGVSAGVCPLAYYVTDSEEKISSQKILNIWKEDLIGNQFISFFNLLRGNYIMNQSYLVDYLLKEKHPIVNERISPTSTPFFITVSDLTELIPRYIRVSRENIFTLIRAATALPIVTRGYEELEGRVLGDGGALDPIPIESLIRKGYRDITVILNQPVSLFSVPIGKIVSKLAYPGNALLRRKVRKIHHSSYNRAKDIMQNPPGGIKIRVIQPEKKSFLKMITTNKSKIHRMIHYGWRVGKSYFEK